MIEMVFKVVGRKEMVDVRKIRINFFVKRVNENFFNLKMLKEK